jgi:hypothetical protein
MVFHFGIISGQLQWVVKEKVTAYGQNLILFCPVENCCSEPAGWFVGPKSIILDVKTFSNACITKYSFKAWLDYNIVTKRISVFVFNAIFVFYIDLTYFL